MSVARSKVAQKKKRNIKFRIRASIKHEVEDDRFKHKIKRKPKASPKPIERRPARKLTSEHHRKPRPHGGKTTPENISIVSIKDHEAWHKLFRNYPPKQIAEIINKKWLDPEFQFMVVPREKKMRRG